MNSNDTFKMRVEYGHFETYVYWGFEIVPLTDTDNETDQSTKRKYELRLQTLDNENAAKIVITDQVLERLWARVKKYDVWQLPSSNYDLDLSDDIYHFSVSVELQKDKNFFVHKIPTGVAVRVPRIQVNKQELVRFYDFVCGTVKDVETLTGVKLPKFVVTKWAGRREDATKQNNKMMSALQQALLQQQQQQQQK